MKHKKLLIGVSLAIALLVGTVSALIPYFGKIITTATVEQAVLVDGQPYSPDISDTIDAVGGECVCKYHYLTSQTNVPVELQFSTSCTATAGDCNDLRSTIVPYMEVTGYETGGHTITNAFDPEHYKKYPYRYDSEPATPNVWQLTTLSEIDTITYTYMVLADSAGDFKPYVVLDLDTGIKDDIADKWVVEMVPPSAPSKGTWYKVTLDGESLFHVPGTACDQFSPCTLATIKTMFPDAVVLKTSIAYGAFPGAETYKAYGGIVQVDTFPTQIDTITLQPEELLRFYICYNFDLLIEADTYTITTTVEPA